MAVVADSFHIKPLLRIHQSADRYHVLGISRHEVKLFEGNRDALDPIEFPADVLQIIADAQERDRKVPHVEVRTSQAGSTAIGARGGGQAAGAAVQNAEPFFRTVDHIILDRYSRPTGLPLLLAALPEHHTPFRRISRNPLLIESGVETNPDALSVDKLRERAWKAVLPHYKTRLTGLIEVFGTAHAQELGDDSLEEVMRAAMAGRVETLLIEADRQIPGRVDAATGAIEFADLTEPDIDDLLDDLAELTMKSGGQVVIVPSEQMPTDSGLAAIYRF
ncbi:MAG: hypothetical protein ACI9R3_001801 [Verrucomicrobiales bacterium]|jgi:hypothetical protein